MALYKSAQVIEIENTSDVSPKEHLDEHDLGKNDVVLFEEMPSKEDVVEIYQPEPILELSFKLPHVPGAPDAEPLEVSEDDVKEDKKDENDLQVKTLEVMDPWDHKSAPDFMIWAANTLKRVPAHSGRDIYGIDRAVAFLDKFLKCLSEAMRNDVDGKLDASKIEHLRTEAENGKDRLEERRDLLESESKKRKKKSDADPQLVKEGQRMALIGGIVVTVPLLISRIARVCINGSLSAGCNIEELYSEQVKKFKLSEREQAETLQLLADMGYAVNHNRLFLPNEEQDFTKTQGDYLGQFRG
jgi:hypothetical protein